MDQVLYPWGGRIMYVPRVNELYSELQNDPQKNRTEKEIHTIALLQTQYIHETRLHAQIYTDLIVGTWF